ncbi:MAG: glycosyltransferase [Lachnospiraceae bacterium]|nr:glycosyltransferase [Lachnospiraceae bacterium]
MKILIVNKFLYPNGGSETYIFQIGQQLMSMGHEVQYFGMEHEGRIVGNRVNAYTADVNFHKKSLAQLTYPIKILYSTEARKKIRLVLDDMQPDVVHLNNINFQITPSIIDEIRLYERQTGRKVRVIATAHDYQWVCPNHMLRIEETGELCARCIDGDCRQCAKHRCIHGSRLRSVLGTMEAQLYRKRHTYRQVDRIICPSSFMQQMLAHNPDLSGRLVTMHNYIADGMLQPTKTGKAVSTSSGEACGKELAEKQKSPYVLYFGRFCPEKGTDTLLKAAEMLPEIHFVFAGTGEEGYTDRINKLLNCEMVGFLTGDALKEKISGAAFSVIPSEWYENCPFTVIESQLYGTPVIASDIGGIPELLNALDMHNDKQNSTEKKRTPQDGEEDAMTERELDPGPIETGDATGILFTPGDADELADRIRFLWNHPVILQKLRANCRENTRGRFLTLSGYTEKLIDIYTDRK